MNPETNAPLMPSSSQPSNPLSQEIKKEDPGQIFGILSLVSIPLGFSFVGIVLGFIGKHKSRQAGLKGTLSTVGIICCSVLTILLIIGVIIAIGITRTWIEKCQELGDGIHVVDGSTYRCNSEAADKANDRLRPYDLAQ